MAHVGECDSLNCIQGAICQVVLAIIFLCPVRIKVYPTLSNACDLVTVEMINVGMWGSSISILH